MPPLPLYTQEFVAFSEFDRQVLRSLIRNISADFKVMLEVGSWLGNGSTLVFIDELSGGRGVLYAVDTWLGNPNVPRHQEIVAEYDVFGTFQRHVSMAGGLEVVKPLLMSSREAAEIMKDDLFDLIFIDADHSYSATIGDIRHWWPKVREDGILCGHDCEALPSEFPLDYLLNNREEDGIAGSDRVPVIHPGPILAVCEAFAGRARLWAKRPFSLQSNRKGHSTIWDIAKKGSLGLALR